MTNSDPVDSPHGDGPTDRELLLRARKLRSRKDFEGALRALASVEAPTDETLLERALVHLGAGAPDLAEPILRSLHAGQAKSARVCSALARIESGRREWRKAVALLREALAIGPASAAERRSLVWNLLNQGEHEDALRELKLAIRDSRGAGLVECHRIAHALYIEVQDFASARAALDAILAIEPADAKAHRAMVAIALRQHDHSRVLELASRAEEAGLLDAQFRTIAASSRLLLEARSAEPAPGIILLSATAPGDEFAGGRYVRSMIDLYPANRLSYFCVYPVGDIKPPAEDIAQLSLLWAAHPVSKRFAAAGTGRSAAYAAAWRRALDKAAVDIAREVVDVARWRRAEVILVSLNDPLLFRIARVLAEITRLRLAVLVADPPDHLWTSMRVPEEFRDELMADFSKVMERAERCATISEKMACHFERDYGHGPLLLRHSLAEELGRPGRAATRQDDELVIAILGSLYAADAISAFFAALESVDWNVAGRRVSIICLTSRLPPSARETMPIRHLGWLEQDAAVAALAEADVGYVPYWFDEAYTTAVEQSFPSKLSTFAAAGLPVFFHGPARSSVVQFLEQRPMGLACTSLEPSDIIAHLRGFAEDAAFFASAGAAAERTFREELSHGVFRSRLMQLVSKR